MPARQNIAKLQHFRKASIPVFAAILRESSVCL